MQIADRMARTVRRYRMLSPGDRVAVAVSGGADSVCLLHLLLELDLRLSILHLNHGLRGSESEADEEFVFSMARRLRLPFLVCHADIAARPGNLEEQARAARLAFFRRVLDQKLADRVAVGHTRSDQAETVLFRFLRGSGTAGLSGIRPVTAWGLVRPLLDVTRAEIEAYLRDRGLRWREDSTNRTPRFARNRIRHDLLPQLECDWNPRMVDTLAATAGWAQAEESYWQAEVDRLWVAPLVCVPLAPAPHPVVLDTRYLAAFPDAARFRLIRRAIHHAKGSLRGVDFRHIEQIAELATAPAGSGRVQTAGVAAERSFHLLRFAALSPPPETWSVPVAPPSQTCGIALELVENSETSDMLGCVYNGKTGYLDWNRLSGKLALRNWRAGDRYRPLGSTGEKKIKTLFEKARIPVWERHGWPVLMDGEAIIWAGRFGPAVEFAATSSSAVLLLVHERRDKMESQSRQAASIK
jgi:tRNA(Ile)-lysidine synthase